MTGAAETLESIRELTYRCGFYSDTKQWTSLPHLFAEDAVIDETALGFPLLTGKAQITAFFAADKAILDFGVHYVTNHFLTEVGETHAAGVNHLLMEGRLRDGTRLKVVGYFEDSYVRVVGKWLFRSRKLTTFTAPEGFDRVSALIRSGQT